MNQSTAQTKREKVQASRKPALDDTEQPPVEEEEALQPDGDDWGYEEAWPEETVSTRRRFRPLVAILAVVAALVLAALGYSLFRMVSQDDQNSLRSGALRAANQYGVYLSSYNYNDLTGPTAPWTLVDQNSTASFRSDFDKTRSSLSSLVKDYHATATGKVVASGLSSVSSGRAVVLLFIDQTVTNSAQKPGSQTQPLRVEVVLAHQHGKWLIDKLNVPS